MDVPEVNAMAYYSPFGSRIALTAGLIQEYRFGRIRLDEVKAVLAHEASHLKSKHPLKNSLVMSIISLTDMFSSGLIVLSSVLSVLAVAQRSLTTLAAASGALLFGAILKVLSKVASIIAFHYMRGLEYEADVKAARLVGREPTISMLKKVDELNSAVHSPRKLFMPERWTLPTTNRSWFEKLFDTHPPIEKRIEKLMREVSS